jgi:metallo-beta-lactamase family protein
VPGPASARPLATIEFLGAAGTVTGAKFLVECAGQRLLVDCGLYQGLKALRLRNWSPFPGDPGRLASVILTHAHIDHTGYLPRLCREGFEGPVHATAGTAELAGIMLPDSGHLQEEEAAFHNRQGSSKHHPALPLYTEEEGAAAARRIDGAAYGAALAPASGVRATFQRAGHILGSASVRLRLLDGAEGRTVLFSGDLGRYAAPILPDPDPVGEADYVVIESTYGDRRHDPAPIADQLERVVLAAVKRGGALVVPAFAVGRTQELIHHLRALEEARRIPVLPTYVDSPMAIEATSLYCAHLDEFDEEMRRQVAGGGCPLHTTRFRLVRSVEESKALNLEKGPLVIIAASGMVTGGRILHHLRRRLPDPRTTVLLVGYQAVATRGRLLQEGARTLRIFGEDVPVAARVDTVHGLSAHADSDGLLRWLRSARRPPRRLFVVHGDPGPAAALAERVRAELGWPVSVPGYRERAPLD